jgi:macrolide-specific efflux system membrane fusion protein
VVKVANGSGRLEERAVEVGVANRVQAEILSGLAEGERVVAGLVPSGNGVTRSMTPRL